MFSVFVFLNWGLFTPPLTDLARKSTEAYSNLSGFLRTVVDSLFRLVKFHHWG